MKTQRCFGAVRLVILGFALLGAAACQSYPFVPYVATPGQSPNVAFPKGTAQNFNANAAGNTDIVLVVDSSGSMGDKQARLAANAQQFIDQLVASGNPFRIGLVTTDMVSTQEQGRLHDFGGGALWLDAPAKGDPNAVAQEQALVQSFVKAVVAVGTSGDSRESGMAAALTAVGSPNQIDPNVTAHNAGFLRSDASLAVVILTDEDDCSRTPQSLAGSSVTAWTPEQCYDPNFETQRLQPKDVIEGLAAVKGGNITRVSAGVIMAGISGSDGSFAPSSCLLLNDQASTTCGCWSWSGSATATTYCAINSENGQVCDVSTTASCNAGTSCIQPTTNACIPQCSAMGGYRYHGFLSGLAQARLAAGVPQGTAAGSICVNTFADSLSTIASTVIAPSCFVLAEQPPASATVQVSLQRSGSATSTPLPHLGVAINDGASCLTCGDCPGGGWTLTGQTVCLACGLFMQPGDVLHVMTLTP